ncbi:pseudouridine synthase [Haematococcus lacustris]
MRTEATKEDRLEGAAVGMSLRVRLQDIVTCSSQLSRLDLADQLQHVVDELRRNELGMRYAGYPAPTCAVAREFDFHKYRQRPVALEVMYIGGAYQGLARQDNTDRTIEAHLFAALRQTRLVAETAQPAELRYSRCGRTDKGVSALGQVISLLLRSSALAAPTAVDSRLSNSGLPATVPNTDDTPPSAAKATPCDVQGGGTGALQGFPPWEQELDYPQLLNKALPDDIRVLGWAPVDASFHARFSLLPGSLMGKPLVEWKMAPKRCCSTRACRCRTHVQTMAKHGIRVRCMVAVLLMVGQGLEQPGVVASLLDVTATPCKPNYTMAPEEPLILYACAYKELHFHRSARTLAANSSLLQSLVGKHLVAAAMASSILQRIECDTADAANMTQAGGGAPRPQSGAPAAAKKGAHVPLMRRPREQSIEERANKLGVRWPWPPTNGATADIEDE